MVPNSGKLHYVLKAFDWLTKVDHLLTPQSEIYTFLVNFPFNPPTGRTMEIITMQWKGNVILLF